MMVGGKAGGVAGSYWGRRLPLADDKLCCIVYTVSAQCYMRCTCMKIEYIRSAVARNWKANRPTNYV